MNDDSVPAIGVTGKHTTDGRPHEYTSLTPFLVIADAARALDFYQEVFGAQLIDVTKFDDQIMQAELDFGLGRLQLGQPNPDFGLAAAPAGDVCYSLGLYCPDADALVARAVQAGAIICEPLTTFVSGDRFASIQDPFGVRWSVMCRVEDLSEAESAARVEEWAAEQDRLELATRR